MVYIPFVSLLGIKAAIMSLASTEPVDAPTDFIDPRLGGGSLLDHDSGGLGEPLNVIISGLSSPLTLSDDGFLLFANAIGFDTECLKIHIGKPQTANLGDRRGWVNQITELRDDYGVLVIGTCAETLAGGNHLRMWRQTTSGALFLAVSEEENVFTGHTIINDGYNLGRESLVKSAVGLKEYEGVKYQTTVQNITGLMPPGSDGVNHGIPTDGVIALLVVTIVE